MHGRTIKASPIHSRGPALGVPPAIASAIVSLFTRSGLRPYGRRVIKILVWRRTPLICHSFLGLRLLPGSIPGVRNAGDKI